MKVLHFALLLITFKCILHYGQSEDLLEDHCLMDAHCRQFRNSNITVNCIDEHCHCTDAKGQSVKCKPQNVNVSNIIGGPCIAGQCPQANSECDEKEDICYCAKGYVPSEFKRRCIKKNVALDDECETDVQCQRGEPNAHCNGRRCQCIEHFSNDNGTCVSLLDHKQLCHNDSICLDMFGEHSKCLSHLHSCACESGFIKLLGQRSCSKVPRYLENCTENLQCSTSMGLGGACVQHQCQCEGRYFEEATRINNDLREICSPFVRRGQYCRHSEDCYQRQLNESEQSMDCRLGECDCKWGFYSYNDGDCVRGSGAIRYLVPIGLYGLFMASVMLF